MRRSEIDDLPNPFSIEQRLQRPTPLLNRLKFFALIAILFASFLAIGNQYSAYRVSQLSSDFASLPASDKLERLDQLAAWGPKAIPTIVAALSDQDDEIAQRTHEVLRRLQNEWTVLEFGEAIANHKSMVAAISANQPTLAADRRELAVDLLQQSARLSVKQDDDLRRQLYFSASAAIEQLSPHAPHASDQKENGEQLDARKRPLPVDHLANGVDWTDWPPRLDVAKLAQTSADHENAPPVGVTSRPGLQAAKPTIHRTSTSPLRAVPDHEVVVLHELPNDRTHEVNSPSTGESMYDPPKTIQPVVHVVEIPWQSSDLATVIKSLALPDQALQNQTRSELVRRGLSETEISIASRVATGNTQSKISLIESISAASGIDARPWLLLLLDDHNREVRLRAISALATIKDPWVQQQLKLKMVDEKDQTVAFRIRRVLNLR